MKVLPLKVWHFRTKLPSQKPMLRQIESGVQNGPITKNTDLPVAILFLWKLRFSIRVNLKYLPTIEMSVFILFLIAGVLFEGVFSLWVSLKLILLILPLETISIRMCHILWEQFCCSCMYTKIARNRLQLFKETRYLSIKIFTLLICL